MLHINKNGKEFVLLCESILFRRRSCGSGLLHQVHLRARVRRRGHEAPVLGADQRQIALGVVGPVLGRFQLPLEPPHPSHALGAHALLRVS